MEQWFGFIWLGGDDDDDGDDDFGALRANSGRVFGQGNGLIPLFSGVKIKT